MERLTGAGARQKSEFTREKMGLEKEINALRSERDEQRAKNKVAETNEAGRRECGILILPQHGSSVSGQRAQVDGADRRCAAEKER